MSLVPCKTFNDEPVCATQEKPWINAFDLMLFDASVFPRIRSV